MPHSPFLASRQLDHQTPLLRGDAQLGADGKAKLFQPQAAQAQVRDGLVAAVAVGARVVRAADSALPGLAWAARSAQAAAAGGERIGLQVGRRQGRQGVE